MKFNVSSKALYNATSAVSKVINSKNSLAILDNFLINLTGNVLTITGSDAENALTARIEVEKAKGRAVCAWVQGVWSSYSRLSPTRA